MPNAVIAHHPDGAFDRAALLAKAQGVSRHRRHGSGARRRRRRSATNGTRRVGGWTSGYGKRGAAQIPRRRRRLWHQAQHPAVARRSGLRGDRRARRPRSAEEIMALKPDGVFLSNGPGDPAETGRYAVPTIQGILETKTPTFGICLGHQMLGLAIGAKTMKMPQGHHGANHPVKDFTTDKVEIVSMNHGFALDPATLAGQRARDPCLAVRPIQLRHRADRPAGVLGAISPRGVAGAAGQPLSVHALRRAMERTRRTRPRRRKPSREPRLRPPWRRTGRCRRGFRRPRRAWSACRRPYIPRRASPSAAWRPASASAPWPRRASCRSG